MKPLLTWGFGERGQVDLIDFSSKPSNGFKFILNYQDHAKKYVWLEKLTNKQTKTINLCLVKNFSLLGIMIVVLNSHRSQKVMVV